MKSFKWVSILLLLYSVNSFALDCGKAPLQINKDWETEINADVAKIGLVKGAELKLRVKNTTNDLLSKLPNADKVYLYQMMYYTYCSALRDDKAIKEADKARQLKDYNNQVMKSLENTNKESKQIQKIAKSQQKILKQQKESETDIRNDIKELKMMISKLQENKREELNAQFPAGYQLFGILDKQIILSQKSSSEDIKIDWSTAKILNITKDFVEIMLPDAIFPGNIILKSNTVIVNNEEGVTSRNAFVINGWSSFVKILKSDGHRIIAAVGYAKLE
jgi:hypothetical protein